MAINLTKAYLDMARMIHTSPDGEASDTQVVVRARADEQGTAVFEAFFPMMAAEVIFSYSALVAFASSQLRSQWEQLQQEFPGYETFDDLMKVEFSDLKKALKKLTSMMDVDPIHEARPQEWQLLNDYVKIYRDFLVHPTPPRYEELSQDIMEKNWSFASSTVSEIIRYLYEAKGGRAPDWVGKGSLSIEGNVLALGPTQD